MPASISLLLISVVAKVNSINPPAEDYIPEPIWKRTNSYICFLIHQAFFNSKFQPNRISRYNLAKYIVLDFCDHWIECHPGEEHVLDVPKRSDCPVPTIQNIY